VMEIPTAFNVPKDGTIDYQYVRMPTNFGEDKYVQFAEARPTDREHTHHIIAFIRDPKSAWMKNAPIGVPFVPGENEGRGSGDFLAGYAPGTIPEMQKPGQVKLIPKGADIIFQLHYTADGKPGTDQSRVGIIFAKEPPKERVLTLAATTEKFAIPPGDPNYRVDSKITLQDDSTLVMMLPHMHLRGKDFEFRVVFPDGRTETLLKVPHYSFSWQLSYYLDQPVFLPKGTTIECTAHYDNSPNNPSNPDPSKEVRYGEQSWDEMMFGFFDVAVPLDKSPMDLMRGRPQHPATSAANHP
jgi:hypothetical protein